MTSDAESRAEAERLLNAMARACEAKLLTPENLSKGLWLDMKDADVRRRLREEMDELDWAIEDGEPWAEIVREAVDVLAFAAMGADSKRRARAHHDE